MTDDPFVAHRSLLFTVAYGMLGSAADAEDVVQESWMRWATIGDAAQSEVRDPRAYLARMVTRQPLNRLRTLAQHVVERFLAAITTGDVHGLLNVLARDVVLVADGGGVAPAVRRPVK